MAERKKSAKNAAFNPPDEQVGSMRDASIKRAIAQASVGIYLTDNQGNCTYANQNLSKMAGSRKE